MAGRADPAGGSYGCSDHASYNRAGFVSSSVFEPVTNVLYVISSRPAPLCCVRRSGSAHPPSTARVRLGGAVRRIHQTGDDLDLVNWPQAFEFIKFAISYVVETTYGSP